MEKTAFQETQEHTGGKCHLTAAPFLKSADWSQDPGQSSQTARCSDPSGNRGRSGHFKYENYATWERGINKKMWRWGRPIACFQSRLEQSLTGRDFLR